ncbi:uncharacterized protein LOC135819662 [Sycon ciliatum]|uniref:uncharacterized protein LOC135819662 n=1 Tax=Sycon ciliatum TaxID=27933 RepID=UPI0031F60855
MAAAAENHAVNSWPWSSHMFRKWIPRLQAALSCDAIRVECCAKRLISDAQKKELMAIKDSAKHNDRLLDMLSRGTAETFHTFCRIVRRTEPKANFSKFLDDMQSVDTFVGGNEGEANKVTRRQPARFTGNPPPTPSQATRSPPAIAPKPKSVVKPQATDASPAKPTGVSAMIAALNSAGQEGKSAGSLPLKTSRAPQPPTRPKPVTPHNTARAVETKDLTSGHRVQLVVTSDPVSPPRPPLCDHARLAAGGNQPDGTEAATSGPGDPKPSPKPGQAAPSRSASVSTLASSFESNRHETVRLALNQAPKPKHHQTLIAGARASSLARSPAIAGGKHPGGHAVQQVQRSVLPTESLTAKPIARSLTGREPVTKKATGDSATPPQPNSLSQAGNTWPWSSRVFREWIPRLQATLSCSTIRMECRGKGLISDTQKKELMAVDDSAKHNELLLDMLSRGTAETFHTFCSIVRSTEPEANFSKFLDDMQSVDTFVVVSPECQKDCNKVLDLMKEFSAPERQRVVHTAEDVARMRASQTVLDKRKKPIHLPQPTSAVNVDLLSMRNMGEEQRRAVLTEIDRLASSASITDDREAQEWQYQGQVTRADGQVEKSPADIHRELSKHPCFISMGSARDGRSISETKQYLKDTGFIDENTVITEITEYVRVPVTRLAIRDSKRLMFKDESSFIVKFIIGCEYNLSAPSFIKSVIRNLRNLLGDWSIHADSVHGESGDTAVFVQMSAKAHTRLWEFCKDRSSLLAGLYILEVSTVDGAVAFNTRPTTCIGEGITPDDQKRLVEVFSKRYPSLDRDELSVAVADQQNVQHAVIALTKLVFHDDGACLNALPEILGESLTAKPIAPSLTGRESVTNKATGNSATPPEPNSLSQAGNTGPWSSRVFRKWIPHLKAALSCGTIRTECHAEGLLTDMQKKELMGVEYDSAKHNDRLLDMLSRGTAETFHTFCSIVRSAEPEANFSKFLDDMQSVDTCVGVSPEFKNDNKEVELMKVFSAPERQRLVHTAEDVARMRTSQTVLDKRKKPIHLPQPTSPVSVDLLSMRNMGEEQWQAALTEIDHLVSNTIITDDVKDCADEAGKYQGHVTRTDGRVEKSPADIHRELSKHPCFISMGTGSGRDDRSISETKQYLKDTGFIDENTVITEITEYERVPVTRLAIRDSKRLKFKDQSSSIVKFIIDCEYNQTAPSFTNMVIRNLRNLLGDWSIHADIVHGESGGTAVFVQMSAKAHTRLWEFCKDRSSLLAGLHILEVSTVDGAVAFIIRPTTCSGEGITPDDQKRLVEEFSKRFPSLDRDELSVAVADQQNVQHAVIALTKLVFDDDGACLNALPEILGGSAYAPNTRGMRKVIDEATLSSTMTRVRRIRVGLIGQFGSGKTSLAGSLRGEEFRPDKSSTPFLEVHQHGLRLRDGKLQEWEFSTAHLEGSRFIRDAETRTTDRKRWQDENRRKSEERKSELEAKANVSHDGRPPHKSGKQHQPEHTQLATSKPEFGQGKEKKGEESKSTISRSHGQEMPGDKILDDGSNDTAQKSVAPAKSTVNKPDDPELISAGELTQGVINEIIANRELMRNVRDEEVIMSMWDCGGQSIFSSLQHFMLSESFVIYLLCFDSVESLHLIKPQAFRPGEAAAPEVIDVAKELENIDHIRHWLTAVHFASTADIAAVQQDHVSYPPIIMVGNFADKLDPDLSLQQHKDMIWSNLCKLCCRSPVFAAMQSNSDGISTCDANSLFLVNNREPNASPEVHQIHTKIQEATSIVLKGKEMPKSWVRFEWILQHLNQVYKEKGYTSHEWMKTMVAEACKIQDERELEELLLFYHSMRVIIYKPTKNPPQPDDLIFYNVQWLIKQINRFMFGKKYLKHELGKKAGSFYASSMEEAEAIDLHNNLWQKGTASMRLVNITLASIPPDIRTKVIDVMADWDLLYELESNSERYLVPSALHKQNPQKIEAALDSFSMEEAKIDSIHFSTADTPLLIAVEPLKALHEDSMLHAPATPMPHSSYFKLLVRLFKKWDIRSISTSHCELTYNTARLRLPNEYLDLDEFKDGHVEIFMAHYDSSGALLVSLNFQHPLCTFQPGHISTADKRLCSISSICQQVCKDIVAELKELPFVTTFSVPLANDNVCGCQRDEWSDHTTRCRDLGYAPWRVRFAEQSTDVAASSHVMEAAYPDGNPCIKCKQDIQVPNNSHCWFNDTEFKVRS